METKDLLLYDPETGYEVSQNMNRKKISEDMETVLYDPETGDLVKENLEYALNAGEIDNYFASLLLVGAIKEKLDKIL